MLRLRGNSIATIDDKGRLKLPHVFRSAFERSNKNSNIKDISGMKFFLTSFDRGASLDLYPMTKWTEIENKLYDLPDFHKEKRKLVQNFSYYGSEIVMDSQARFVIPLKLRELAGLVGEISVLGNISYLSFWNNERFEQKASDSPNDLNDLDALSLLGI